MEEQTTENQGSGPKANGAESSGTHAPKDDISVSAERAKLLVHELAEYVRYLLQTQADLVKAKLKAIGLYAGLGVLALIGAGLVVMVSLAMLLIGLAMAMGEAMGGRLWAGCLVVGGGLIIALALGIGIVWLRIGGLLRKGTELKYEKRKQEQRKRFGRDVEQAAREEDRRE